MASAAFIIINNQKIEKEAIDVTEEERFCQFRCLDENCNCLLKIKAFNSKKIKPYFAAVGNHKQGCPYGLSKKTIVNTEYDFELDEITNYEDSELKEKYNNVVQVDEQSNGGISKDEKKDNPFLVEDNIKVNRTKKVYQLAISSPEVFQEYGYNLDAFFINSNTIERFRKIDFSYTPILVELKKCSPSSLNPPINKPDYFACFVDVYTKNLRNAIYFFIHLDEVTHNQLFWQRIKNMKYGDILVVFTDKFTLVKNDNYRIYIAGNLNSREYCIYDK